MMVIYSEFCVEGVYITRIGEVLDVGLTDHHYDDRQQLPVQVAEV